MADFPALEVQFLRAPGPDTYLRERLYALLDDFGPTAIQEDEAGELWRVFFVSASQRDGAAAHLGSLVSPDLLRTSPIEVPDEDWARRSQQNLKAVTVDGLVIAPPWDVPGPRAATSAEGRDLPVDRHRTVYRLRHRSSRDDAGCACDCCSSWSCAARASSTSEPDPACWRWQRGSWGPETLWRSTTIPMRSTMRGRTSRATARGAAIDVVRDDLGQLKVARADVVVANLTAALLVRHVVALMELIRRRGYLVLSGFAPPQGLVDVMPAYRRLRLVQELVEGDWQAVLLGTA